TCVSRQIPAGTRVCPVDPSVRVCSGIRQATDVGEPTVWAGRSVGSRVSRHAQDGGFQAVEVKRRRPALSVVAVVTAAVTAIVL
ncbi:MAG: hypothetical protein PUB74_01780, partial [Bifidobacterium boum]|nr:hypothetical protein [Bifidobacterium boum]